MQMRIDKNHNFMHWQPYTLKFEDIIYAFKEIIYTKADDDRRLFDNNTPACQSLR